MFDDNFLKSMLIATEADNKKDDLMSLGDDGKDDISRTDDIFGIQEEKEKKEKANDETGNTPSGDPEEDSNEEENSPEEENQDQNNEPDAPNDAPPAGQSGDPNVDSTPPEGEPTADVSGNPDTAAPQANMEFAEKNKVRDNMVLLYNIFCGDIETLVNTLNNTEDRADVTVINAVLNHMRNAKDYLYKVITKSIEKYSYDELLQRYITMKRVYEICEKMLETHFKKNKDDKE